MPNYKDLKRLLESLVKETQAVWAQGEGKQSLMYFCETVSCFSELNDGHVYVYQRAQIRTGVKEIKAVL